MEARPRKSHSPTRQRLSALSPLQAFSPLEQPEKPDRDTSYFGTVGGPTSATGTGTGIGSRTKAQGHSHGHCRSSSSSSALSISTSASASVSGYSTSPINMLHRSLSTRDRERDRSLRRDPSGDDLASPRASVTTRLILVKAPQEDQDPAWPLRQRSNSSSNLDRIAKAAPVPLASNNAPPTSASSPRRSFASASFSSFAATPFAPISRASEPLQSSPGGTGAGGLQRRPSLSTTRSMPLSSSKTLSPEEVVELAQAIMSPVAAPSSPDKATGLQRRKSTGGAASMSRKQSMSAVHKQSIELEPVDYVQMDEDTLLPFSDRPSQVAELLNNPVNADMLSQLKQAFRGTTSGSGSEPTAIRPNWKTIDVTEWTWDEFLAHLTTITRAECADYEWVLLARTAVRAHSVAVWERLGACLGCDSELITAGNEDEAGPAAWSGLGLGEEGEYDPALACVHIEALEAVDPAEDEEQEAALALEFGDPVPEDFESLWALSFTDSTPMETIGERDEQSSTSGSSTATSVKPALARPLLSPLSTGSATATGGSGISGIGNNCSRALSSSSAVSLTSATSDEGPRSPSGSRSFVGLQIMTSSSSDTDIAGLGSPPGSTFAKGFAAPQYERTPGNPLFVSSFNTLSLGPNLGRKASMVGSATAPTTDQIAPFRSSVPRRLSGTGLSESAVTFVTDLSF